MGPGMMGGYTGNGGWGPMMNSGDYSWMMGGTWRNMTRQDWQRLQQQWLGTSATTGHRGWSPWALAAVTLAAALLAALAILTVVTRRLFRRKPAATST